MTLNDLIRKANALAMQISSGDIELCDEGFVQITDIELEFLEDEDGPYIQMTVK